MKNKQYNKKILIIGGFNKAKSLCESFINKGYIVTAINKNYDDCEALAQIKKLNVIYGDGSKPFVLEDANASENSVAIALTDSDETNLIICEMCKNFYKISKTVCLLNDPSKTDFFYKMGVNKVVCALNMVTNIMEEQALMDEMTEMIPLDHDNLHVAELRIPKGSNVIGKRLWELNISSDIIIGCILRGDTNLIPRGDTRLIEGDDLLIITSDKKNLLGIKELMINDEK